MSDAMTTPAAAPAPPPAFRSSATGTSRIPSRFVYSYGPAQIWVDDDKLPLTSAAAREIANRAAERGATCTRCQGEARIRLVRSHEPTAALCETCFNPALNDAISSTRG